MPAHWNTVFSGERTDQFLTRHRRCSRRSGKGMLGRVWSCHPGCREGQGRRHRSLSLRIPRRRRPMLQPPAAYRRPPLAHSARPQTQHHRRARPPASLMRHAPKHRRRPRGQTRGLTRCHGALFRLRASTRLPPRSRLPWRRRPGAPARLLHRNGRPRNGRPRLRSSDLRSRLLGTSRARGGRSSRTSGKKTAPF